MSRLPRDIIIDILTRLPVKSIARFKCVCKPWLYLFDDIQFRKLHYDNQKKGGATPIKIFVGKGNDLYAIDAYNPILSGAVKIVDYPFRSKKNQSRYDDRLGILGSCHGLVCIRRLRRFYIWNPSTKEHKIIAKPKPDQMQPHWGKYGFGYDLKNQDYKLIRVESFENRSLGSQIWVYSLASNSWSTTPYTTPYTFSRYARPTAFYFNGALHCLTHRLKGLVSFDLGDHTIREVPGPMENNFFDDSSYGKSVDVLGGELCMICILPGVRGDVWVMKEYGVRESWTKLFTVPQEAMNFVYFRPIGYMHNREQVLLSVRLRDTSSNVLVCYNIKCKTARTLSTHDSDPIWCQANTYEESSFTVLGNKHNSVGVLRYLDYEQVEQEEEALSEHDHKRR